MKKQTHKSLDIDFVEIIENSLKLAIEKSNEELIKEVFKTLGAIITFDVMKNLAHKENFLILNKIFPFYIGDQKVRVICFKETLKLYLRIQLFMSHLHSKTSEVNFVFSRKLSNSFLVYSKQLIEKRDINFFYMQSELIYNNSYLFPDRNFNVSDLSIPNSFKLSYATIIPFCWQSWLWHLYRFKDIEKRDFYNFQILLSYKPIGYKDLLNILSTLHNDEVMLSWTLFDNLRTGGSLSDWALWGITIYLIAQKSNLKNKLTEFEKYILKLYKDDFISHVNEIIENYHKWNEAFGNSEKISDSLHGEGQNFKSKVYEYFNNNNMFNSLKLLKKENILEFREILDSL